MEKKIDLDLNVKCVPLTPLTIGQFKEGDPYGEDGQVVIKSTLTEIVVSNPSYFEEKKKIL